MRSEAKSAGLSGFRATARQIAKWRRTRRAGASMPEALWQEAVGLARACGMMPTVRALKIDYGKLKKRVVAAGDAKLAAPRSRSVPRFVDVGAASELGQVGAWGRAVAGATVVELTLGTGERLTIRVEGGQPIDVAGLIRELRSKW